MVNGSNVLANATNTTLALTNAQLGQSGNTYSVIVSNAFGVSNSPGAVLTVLPNQVHYVDLNSTNPVSPYTNWATAAATIQDAVDASTNADEVMVTNGIYQYGGRTVPGSALTNRLIVAEAITVQSVNGPFATVIKGFQVSSTTNGPGAMRCAYLANGAKLVGFTLTNGATLNGFAVSSDQNGGGVLCASGNEVLSNCVIIGNAAYNEGGGVLRGTLNNCTMTGNVVVPLAAGQQQTGRGGGAALSTLNECTLTGNSAALGGGIYGGTVNDCILAGNVSVAPPIFGHPQGSGGGANSSTLNNCVLTGNTASFGGGTIASALNDCTVVGNSAVSVGGGVDNSSRPNGFVNNCIVLSNSAPTGSNYFSSTFAYCCTTPLPTNGLGNITNAPLFVNPAAGDFHLQSNSPCINAGYNPYVSITNDLDGNPRISGGTVDIGAYEFQNPASIISYAWLQQYGLPTDGFADFLDSDHNGMNNWQKWIAGLDPTNPSSVLQLLSPTTTTNPPGLVVTWQSAPNISYYLQRATNLSIQPAFQPLATNLPGQPGTTSFTDTNAPAPGLYFYRVGVQHP